MSTARLERKAIEPTYRLWTACLRVLTFRADRTARYNGHDAHVHRTLEHAERLLVALGEEESRERRERAA